MIKINYNSIYNIRMYPPLFHLFNRQPGTLILRGTKYYFILLRLLRYITSPLANLAIIVGNSCFHSPTITHLSVYNDYTT